MKPFNLKEALEGKPVVTRDGTKITRVVHFPEATAENLRLIAVKPDGKLYFLCDNGRYLHKYETEDDLFMAPTKHEGWTNIYHNLSTGVYVSGNVVRPTKEEAEKASFETSYSKLIATVHVEWEE